MTSPGIYFPSSLHFTDISLSLQTLFRGESRLSTFPISEKISLFCYDENGILFYTSIEEDSYFLHALGSRFTFLSHTLM